MPIIEVRQLAKSYRVYNKREGLADSVRGLFRREYREVNAVQGIDLNVDQGEFVAFLGPMIVTPMMLFIQTISPACLVIISSQVSQTQV